MHAIRIASQRYSDSEMISASSAMGRDTACAVGETGTRYPWRTAGVGARPVDWSELTSSVRHRL